MISQSIQMNNGSVLEGNRISELVKYIINKFADEELSFDEAKIVISRVEAILGEFAVIHNTD